MRLCVKNEESTHTLPHPTRRFSIRRTASILLLLTLTACHPPSATPPDAGTKRDFPVIGLVKALEPDGKTVVIQHDAVSNYMPAMTMPFEAKDPKELTGLHAGDTISFHMVVADHDGWIENITKLSNAAPAESAAISPPPAPAPASEPLQIVISPAVPALLEGDLLPADHLTNETGQAVNLADFRGQVIAFTFFFTRCPFPTACPLLSDNLAGVQKQLPVTADAPALWHLFSISFDQSNDTPALLQEYATHYQADPAHWSFLTGSPGEIRTLTDQFGQEFENNGHTISHNFRTVVVAPDGRVSKIIPGNAWNSDELIRDIIAASKKPR